MTNDVPEEKLSGETPATSPTVPFGFGKDVNGYLNQYVAIADAKAGAFLAANFVVATILLDQEIKDTVAVIIMLCSLAFLTLSGAMCASVLFPRLPRGGKGLIFWEDIREWGSPTSYWKQVQKLKETQVEEAYASQNFYVSQACPAPPLRARSGRA